MTQSAKQRQSDALGAAREYYRLARASLDPTYPQNPNSARASAQALLGILRLQLELIEGQWDAPCDCFAPTPEATPGYLKLPEDEPRTARCPNTGSMCNCTGECLRTT